MRKAPPLNLADVQEAPPSALFWVLRNGSLKCGMRSFAHLPEPHRWQIYHLAQNLERKTIDLLYRKENGSYKIDYMLLFEV